MKLGAISVRRVWLIAQRDFLGYIRTWGFWLSFFMPVLFVLVGYMFTQLDIRFSPVRYAVIFDESGESHSQGLLNYQQNIQADLERQMFNKLGRQLLSPAQMEELMQTYETEGFEGSRTLLETQFKKVGTRLKKPRQNFYLLTLPVDTLAELRDILRTDKLVSYENQPVPLDAVLHLYKGESGRLQIDYWSENFTHEAGIDIIRNYFHERATRRYLQTGGLSQKGLQTARQNSTGIRMLDPSKPADTSDTGQTVTIEDRMPYYIGAGLSLFLWFSIFSATYMLMLSMLEEKLNKLLEMMLSTTRLSEIIFGKLLGVAALTFTAMLPYILLAMSGLVALILWGRADVAAGVQTGLNFKVVFFFGLFLILGYVFYGALFITLGAWANSIQDAQTLSTPIILILTLCVLVVPFGLRNPDSELLFFATWFPLSAPFAILVRLAADPPLWEVLISALSLLLSSVGVIALTRRIFRVGILSGRDVQMIWDGIWQNLIFWRRT